MKLASYIGTRAGWRGIGNRITRWRLDSEISHCEIVFEPGELVDSLMPDRTAAPIDGEYWCASSTATDIMPDWSPIRAGHVGGVRFKRIDLDPAKWILHDLNRCDAVVAAEIIKRYQGAPYDWRYVASFVNWLVPEDADRFACSEICAMAMGLADPWRFDPAALDFVARLLK